MIDIKLNALGLIPAVVQDASTGTVLMLGYMNRASIERTMEGNQVCFYSRSRGELWLKGETSGNYMNVQEILVDCDSDTLLLKVEIDGHACHKGDISCFSRPGLAHRRSFLIQSHHLLLIIFYHPCLFSWASVQCFLDNYNVEWR